MKYSILIIFIFSGIIYNSKNSILIKNEHSDNLIAIGDIHGCINNLKQILIENDIIDYNDNWIAAKTTVVQTGDLIGRGNNDKEVLEYVMEIQKKAKENGGEWIQLLGNHEWMELNNQFHYAKDGYNIGFGSLSNRKFEFEYGKIGRWLRSLPIIYQWNDVLFVHGGMSIEVSKYSIEYINKVVKDYFDGKNVNNNILDTILWDRKLAENKELNMCSDLDIILKKYNASKLVVGHTITATIGYEPGYIAFKCTNKFVLIDVGISSFFKDIPKKWNVLKI